MIPGVRKSWFNVPKTPGGSAAARSAAKFGTPPDAPPAPEEPARPSNPGFVGATDYLPYISMQEQKDWGSRQDSPEFYRWLHDRADAQGYLPVRNPHLGTALSPGAAHLSRTLAWHRGDYGTDDAVPYSLFEQPMGNEGRHDRWVRHGLGRGLYYYLTPEDAEHSRVIQGWNEHRDREKHPVPDREIALREYIDQHDHPHPALTEGNPEGEWHGIRLRTADAEPNTLRSKQIIWPMHDIVPHLPARWSRADFVNGLDRHLRERFGYHHFPTEAIAGRFPRGRADLAAQGAVYENAERPGYQDRDGIWQPGTRGGYFKSYRRMRVGKSWFNVPKTPGGSATDRSAAKFGRQPAPAAETEDDQPGRSAAIGLHMGPYVPNKPYRQFLDAYPQRPSLGGGTLANAPPREVSEYFRAHTAQDGLRSHSKSAGRIYGHLPGDLLAEHLQRLKLYGMDYDTPHSVWAQHPSVGVNGMESSLTPITWAHLKSNDVAQAVARQRLNHPDDIRDRTHPENHPQIPLADYLDDHLNPHPDAGTYTGGVHLNTVIPHERLLHGWHDIVRHLPDDWSLRDYAEGLDRAMRAHWGETHVPLENLAGMARMPHRELASWGGVYENAARPGWRNDQGRWEHGSPLDAYRKAYRPDLRKTIAPPRPVPPRPGRHGRRLIVGETPEGGMVHHIRPEHAAAFLDACPPMVADALEIFLSERCLFSDAPHLLGRFEAAGLSKALAAGCAAVLADPKHALRVLKAAGGKERAAAHLLAADCWQDAAAAMATAANLPEALAVIAAPHRPRGGFPAFDDSLLTLAEWDHDGDI